VRGGIGSVEYHGELTAIYTPEAVTADEYIERAAKELAKEYRVTVATSDSIEQIIIIGSGANRLSAPDFLDDVKNAEEMIRNKLKEITPIKNNQLLDNLDEKTARMLELLRLGIK
jgi:predicted RNA-binding protein with PIN domain